MPGDNQNPNRPRLLPGGVPRSKEPLTWREVGPKYMAPDQDPVSVINKMGDEVAYAARESDLPGVHNGPGDAYRHSLGAAAMTRKYGSHIARLAGVANEVLGAGKAVLKGESPAWRETLMDLNNNERGIQMASDGSIPNKELWAKVWDAASKTKIPSTNAEALAEAMAGRLTALPPGKPKEATLDEYARAFNADTAIASPIPKPLKVANVEWQPPKPIEPVELNNRNAERYLAELAAAKAKAQRKQRGG